MKETHYKLKHRVTALFAAAVMLCSMLPGAAFAEEPTPQPTEETVQMEQQTEPSETDNGQTDASSPDLGAATEESAAPTTDEPAEENEPYTFDGEVLYQDMPDAPTGSYLGSYGLPVATGETKIGLGAWDADLEQDSYLSAEALDSDNLTLATPLLEDTDYAIVPILAQVEYPTDGSTVDLVLPDSVTLLDYYGEPAKDAESLLHSEYSETSAAVLGVYVQADADFTAQLVYTAPDGSCLTKTLQVTIDRNATAEYPFPDSEIATFAERPTPAVTSGKITKVAKVNGTWLIWFNGEPAYCCTHGANGQPAGCPTYTYVNTSTVNADQCIPGDHYGNQIRIWGGLNQLSLGDADDLPAVFSADEGEETSLLDFCESIYDDVQMYIIESFPESTAAEIYLASADELLNGVETYASARGYYTYIYNPGRTGWQTVALIGPEIGEEEPEPEPVVQEYYASWEAPAQTASGSFDFPYGIRTDKIQLKTQEKVDGATIEIEPITKSGSIDGGSWSVSPTSKQTVTTSGHTADDNYQKNGGDASASWSLHYAVTKTSGTRNGQVGPFTTQEAADAAANSARDTAIAELQGEAQSAVNNAIAAAKAQLGSIKFRYEEITVPYGFGKYWGTNGSSQTISVPANTNNDYVMKNDEWSLQVNLKKTDSETGSPIAADAQYEIYQWDSVSNKFLATGGYNTYSVQRQGDGTYAVINSAAYATTDAMRHTLYYTQRNQGKFILVETKAPAGYFGDWTDIDHPGTAGTPLGKRAYYIEITQDNDSSVLWLDNADYNADILTADKGGTKLVTGGGVETTVSIYSTAKDSTRTYSTDNSGKAANEDSYTTTATDGVMKNDRTLGEISISKVDLDAAKYVENLLFENVVGLINHDHCRTFATILNTLDRLGYGVEWQCLNSKDFGVPQSRNRVYIIGYLDERCRGKVFPFTETAGSSLIQTHGGHQGERVYSPEGLSCTLAANPGGFGGKTGLYEVGVPIKCATKTGYQMAQVGDSIDLSYATVNSRRGRVGKQIAHTLTTGCRQGTLNFIDLNPDPKVTEVARCVNARVGNGIRTHRGESSGVLCEGRIRRLTPRECLRLQGWADDRIDTVLAIQSDNQAYKQAGNGVTVNVVEAIGRRIAAMDAELRGEALAP